MKSLRPLAGFVAILAVVCSMTYCAVEVSDDIVEKDKVVKPDDEGGGAPPPPPEPTLMDSLNGSFSGTCIYAYLNFEPSHPPIEEFDTTFNSLFKVTRINSEQITIDGCGSSFLGNLYFPITLRTDTTYYWHYYIGDHIQSLTIDFPNRSVSTFHRVNGFGGDIYYWQKGVWKF